MMSDKDRLLCQWMALTGMFLFLVSAAVRAGLDAIPEDLGTWTEQGSVLTGGGSGAWDENLNKTIGPHGFGKVGDTYYLFYQAGFSGCWNDTGSHGSMGLATSSDGINFTKHGSNPLLSPHDFLPVSSHEEGIRLFTVQYVSALAKWVGYFGVESPGGSQTCSYMQESCDCNIEVDAYVYRAESSDGVNWTVIGEVSGANSSPGHENYPADFQYVDGTYYLWTVKAQGGYAQSISSGTDPSNLTYLGEITGLDFGWSALKTFVHNDSNTVTLIYNPHSNDDEASTELKMATQYLDGDLTVRLDERVLDASLGDPADAVTNRIFKDADNSRWLWYYTKEADDNIYLRTHTLEAAETDLGSCGLIAEGDALPYGTWQAPPWYVFDPSPLKRATIKVDCSVATDTVDITVGLDESDVIVYHQGYVSTDGGTTWTPVVFSGSAHPDAGGASWIQGLATLSGYAIDGSDQQETDNMIAAYICRYTGGVAECGCQDNQVGCDSTGKFAVQKFGVQ